MRRHGAIIRLLAVVAAVALAKGCGGGDSPVAPPPDPARPTAVTVNPATAELSALGATVQLTAQVRDQSGQAMAVSVAWASSDPSAAAVDASGLVTAASNGATTISASAGAASGTALITVIQTASRVVVSPPADTLVAGDTLRLSAEAFDANAHEVVGASFTWASSDAAVAVVDTTGLVRAEGAGEAEITATAGSASGSVRLVVVPAATTAVRVTPDTVTLTALGDTIRLQADVRDGLGRPTTGAATVWASSDPSVATVDSAGLVRAAGNGTAVVTATVDGASGEAVVAVAQEVSGVAVSPPVAKLTVGDTARLAAEATDANGHAVADVAFAWSSSDTMVATVDGSGLVRARAVGESSITAATGDWRGSSQVVVGSSDPADHHAALTTGLPERPFVNATVGGSEGSTETVGTLRLGLNPDASPVIVQESEHGPDVLVARSSLGSGRVVALSGQDFLGSSERATLVGHEHVDRFLANAVRWTGGDRATPLRILADNQRIADALDAQGLEAVAVVGRQPGRRYRNWSASALEGADVAVVQINEWGTARLTGESVAPLRAFVEGGGGLVIAGSALHWNWWIEDQHGPFAGDVLLHGTGISWNKNSIDDITSATTRFDARLLPGAVWAAWLGGEGLDPTQLAMLPGLFDAALDLGRLAELDTALVRLVRETPPLPAFAHVPEARLAAEVARTLGAHEWPEAHPWASAFPGLPDPGARRVDGFVVMDATGAEFPADARRRERHLPLGFYAPPGGLVTISVPSSHATGELKIAVGWDHNDLREGHPAWRRAPTLRRIFDVTAPETAVTNAWGGSISLIVPASYRRSIPVSVEGAISMAVYTAGESNQAEWFEDLRAGAPQAIIQQPGGIRFVISAESARGVTNPEEVAAWWGGFQRHHAELSGEPVPRAYESIWIFDPHVGIGYANAGWLTINYPLHAEAWVLVPGTAEGRRWLATLPNVGPTQHTYRPPRVYSPAAHGVDWWLFGHELGHQWQTEDWGRGSTSREIGEVAVNLFTMYTLNKYIFGGDDSDLITDPRLPNSVDHAALSRLNWPTSDLFERLQLYRQLIFEFGWEPMRAVFRSYYDPAYPRSTYGGGLDGFAIRFSAIAQRDLIDFFRHWQYPLSESAATTIRSFGLEAWLPPGW